MKAHAETHTNPSGQQAHAPFIRRGGEGSFFSETQPRPFFQPSPIQRMDDETMGLQTKRGPLQAKLTVGQSGDKYEQEADHVADQVVRMPEPQVQRQSEEEEELVQTKETPGAPPQIQQMCAECQEEAQRQPLQAKETSGAAPQIQRMCTKCQQEARRQPTEEGEEDVLQPKSAPGQAPRVTSGVESQVRSLQGGGRPLSTSVRNFMEPRFGRDLGHIRLHTDSRAAASASALNARAYTIGHNVVMGGGQYAPNTTGGKRLLAHELTHTVQQGATAPTIRKTRKNTPHIQKTPISRRSFAKTGLRVQRQGEDLRSSRFSGNRILEQAFDATTTVSQNQNSNGAHVKLIQDSLIAQRYTLPLHGPDSDYGPETAEKVEKFQIDTGAQKLDGIVGPETMRLLDMHDPGGSTGVPPPGGGAAPAVPRGAVFSEAASETFAGYDNTTGPNSLVVGVNERRRADVAIAPPGALPTFVSDTPANATVVPTNTGITVTGISAGPAKIEARDGPGAGANVLGTLNVTVKNQVDKTVAFHYVCDSRGAAAGGPHCSDGSPSPDEMRTLLNRVWHRQANVRFTVGNSHNIVVPGDMGPYVNDDGFGGDEMGIVTAAAPAPAAYNVFRVWEVRVRHGEVNNGLNNANNTLIGDAPCGDGFGLPHEAGHFLGLGHGSGFIMTPCPGARSLRISKAMIDTVNP